MSKCMWLFVFAVMAHSLAAQDGWPGAQQPKPAQDPELVVPAGTVIPVVLDTYLTTKNTQVGDVFYADTTYPIWIQQRLVIPRGSIIKGTVTEVMRPGTFKGKGKMAVRFDTVLLPNGVERQLVADFHGIHGPGAEKIDRKTETVEAGGGSENTGREVGSVVGTAGTGAIIGGVSTWGGAGGPLIGAGAGAAAGAAIVLLSRERHLMLERGTQLDLELRQPLRFAYNEVIFSQSDMDRVIRKYPEPARPLRQQRRSRPFIPFTPRLGR